jgi:uncharacterized membrane protein
LLLSAVMRTRGKRWHHVTAAAAVAGAVAPALLRWVRRTGHRRRTVDLRMTVVVERPISEVFLFCRDFANFPQMLDVLESVEDFEDGRSRWVVRAPGGERIQWDAAVTKYVPNSVIAWESLPNSSVRASGLMRFAPLDDGVTRLDVTLTYRPVRTQLRDAIQALVHPANTVRLREEISRASLELGHR